MVTGVGGSRHMETDLVARGAAWCVKATSLLCSVGDDQQIDVSSPNYLSGCFVYFLLIVYFVCCIVFYDWLYSIQDGCSYTTWQCAILMVITCNIVQFPA